jgi:hypothetical protein
MPKPDGVVGGAGATTTLRVAVVDPPALPAVRLTVNVPAVAYAWMGFWSELVPPSPKVHDHDVGFPVLASLNCTLSLAVGDAGASVKAAAGAAFAGAADESDPLPPQPANTSAPSRSPDTGAQRVQVDDLAIPTYPAFFLPGFPIVRADRENGVYATFLAKLLSGARRV